MSAFAMPASANEISRWTDAEGNVHFGNPQFAPSGQGEAVHVHTANAMDVPEVARTRDRAGTPSVSYLKKAAKQNPRGWRGFNARKAKGRRR